MDCQIFRPLAVLALLSVCLAPPAWAQSDPYSVVHGWPRLPAGFVLGQISGVGVDSHNRVFVFNRAENSWPADPSNLLGHGDPANPALPAIKSPTILCFDGDSGELLASWGAGRFIRPHGLRIDRHDHVWVTDLTLNQVFEFSNDGQLLRTIGTERGAGIDGTHFNQPADLAFAPDGSLYVSDGYGNNRIAKFAPDGRFLLDWGRKGDGPGEFDLPHSIAVDAAGLVYVADRGNARIQVFDANGKLLNIWKSKELGRPWSLTIGPDNMLYVVDGGDVEVPFPPPAGRGQLLKLDLTGKIVAKWSRFGNYDGQIYWGHDIAVGRDGAVYVGDVYFGMRVQKFVPRR